jgi:hypothetical protein
MAGGGIIFAATSRHQREPKKDFASFALLVRVNILCTPLCAGRPESVALSKVMILTILFRSQRCVVNIEQNYEMGLTVSRVTMQDLMHRRGKAHGARYAL